MDDKKQIYRLHRMVSMFMRTGLVGMLSALLAFSLFTPTIVSAEALTLPVAINKAGRQRMLTQRMVKAYGQLGMELQYAKAEKQLNSAIFLFESQLEELKQFSNHPDIKAGLDKVESLWAPVKAIVTVPQSRDKIEELRANAEALLKAAHAVVVMLEELSGTSQGKLVNIAGRQRMLSQRIANLYVLQSWGFEQEQYLTDYNKAISEFESALKLLKSAPENTLDINAALKEVSLQWGVFKISAKLEKGQYIPALITRSADKILTRMNDITGMYAALP